MINIQDLIPFMKEGWVAMDKDGSWWWFECQPKLHERNGFWNATSSDYILIDECFLKEIDSVDDWTKSLIKVG